jgi:hypothetical protein
MVAGETATVSDDEGTASTSLLTSLLYPADGDDDDDDDKDGGRTQSSPRPSS